MSSARRSVVPLVIAGILGLALIIGVRVLLGGGGVDPQSGGGGQSHRSDCMPLNVVASSEKAALLKELAQPWMDRIRTCGPQRRRRGRSS